MRAGVLSIAAFLCAVAGAEGESSPRPNILWITSEDNGPHLGCYGDAYATTPTLDGLAAKGCVYLNVWSSAPVCAPARTAIITGVYPPSLGAEHMRSLVPMPAPMRMFPQLLREAGYYCTNNSKEDYNLEKPGKVWDMSSAKAHWRNRRIGQPFFAVFNLGVTHESQIRKRPHQWKHDVARVRVPVYHPDTPEVRQDWAQYYDQLSEMDSIASQHLRELEEAGVADDTIVFYYGDNGPGMPRGKRSPCDSGLHVPLIVYLPPKWRNLAATDYASGGRSQRLIRFEDLAPTALSLAGIQPPGWMQGRTFLGPCEMPSPEYITGFRGRMDERYDLVRSIRNQRYVYVRNYMPHLPAGQHVAYMFETPTTRVWKQLFDQGKLAPPKTRFWEPKAPEELYDLKEDPDEVQNLADSPAHQDMLRHMRTVLRQRLLKDRDLGFLPEGEIHRRSQGSTPYDVGRDEGEYPMARILAMAEQASSLETSSETALTSALLEDADSAVRYWAAMGILMRGRTSVEAAEPALRQALKDPSPHVQIVAAEALARFGTAADLPVMLGLLIDRADVSRNGIYVSLPALNAIDALGGRAAGFRSAIAALPRTHPSVIQRMESSIPKILDAMLGNPR
ncbi:MAG TPA: sulfatase-like hydrolase/transferase [Phycisphaerae bacterium]|nr:sulfatase-like hydrolase/transferase [Phycisphaerae bacterium]HRY70363.1 sulfatase-like hydrolase/transferase [Phycisphaerae bacterium]HSA28080.1 sulfatase-like hydrolase/transferase [Phycisphaerae bacterium]